MKETFGRRWLIAVTGAIGKVGFDYLALVCCLAAVGVRPSPSLVLLAYIGGALLALIPITPGGLGFVEAGLTGILAAAGVEARTLWSRLSPIGWSPSGSRCPSAVSPTCSSSDAMTQHPTRARPR